MRTTVTLDMTPGYEHCRPLELTVRLRVPVAADAGDEEPRVSLDHRLEQIRQQMRLGTAAKVDEDNLVVFRLLQAFGFEYWPLREDDL